MTRYYVTTWDTDADDFTPQKGVRVGPYTLFGLRKALRRLQGMGYPCDRHDPSVLVQDEGAYGRDLKRRKPRQKTLFT